MAVADHNLADERKRKLHWLWLWNLGDWVFVSGFRD